MLMINYIKCHLFKHVHKIGEFYDKDTVFFKQVFYVFRDFMDIINVRKHIRGCGNIGMALSFNYLTDGFFAEEVIDCFNAVLLSDFRDVGCRLNPDCLHFHVLEALKQNPVIAPYVHGKGVFIESIFI